MIKVLGRHFATYEQAKKFLEISIRMERSERIKEQLQHKLEFLEKEYVNDSKPHRKK